MQSTLKNEPEAGSSKTGSNTEQLLKKEKAVLTNQLTGLIKGLEGIRIMVDLRNEHTLVGTVLHVDGYMNIDFVDVFYYCDLVYQPQKSTYFEKFLLKNRQIRYVHLPKDLHVRDTLQEVIKRLTRRKMDGRPTNHKAFARHLKVLKDIDQTRKNN